MNTNNIQSKGKTVTKSKIKVMNFEKEFFPKKTCAKTNTIDKQEEEARKTTEGAKRALQEFLMA
ncbi:hypothetical protein [Porticoccus hydrocarbonoclasticus]|uniref:hypothetical protein n=1 Tax=Porticoccus hydrocarbonoclasticus TaxID=1073414 RepID=UPI00055AF60A|nr:hypothetical protein [Porticoccus hydrocarbonoclasticus]